MKKKMKNRSVQGHRQILLLIAFVVIIMASLFIYNSLEVEITGKTTTELPTEHSFEVNEYLTQTKIIPLELESGNLNSLSITGNYIGEGGFKIYLESNGKLILIADSKKIEPISSLELANTEYDDTIDLDTNTEEIQINLQYADDPEYDPENNGVGRMDNLIDFTVANSIVPENTSLLCTRWTVNDDSSVCYGNENCCAFLELPVKSTQWDYPFYLSAEADGAGKKNLVKARIINFNIEDEINVTFSMEAALLARFYGNLYSFDSYCDKSCEITDKLEGDYNLIVEITDDIYLNLDSIDYSLIAEETEKITKHLPDIVLEDKYDWGGDYKLIDNYDDTFDLKIFTTPRTKYKPGFGAQIISTTSNGKIKSIKKLKKNKISVRIDETNDDRISTEVFALQENISFDEATITLRKTGLVNFILRCTDFNLTRFECDSSWDITNIPFTDHGETISFRVTTFTAYAGGGGNESTLVIYDDNDIEGGSQNKGKGVQINFFANYSNTTTALGINDTIGWCNISFNVTPNGPFNMSFQNGSQLWQYNRSFTDPGNYTWNVTCGATGYETLNATDTINIIACGNIITNTTLTGNLQSNGTCFTIGADNIILDCAGYSITGNGTGSGYGVLANLRNNVTIKNCKIQNFSHGIFLNYSNSSFIYNNTLHNNSEFYLYYGSPRGSGDGLHLNFSHNNNITLNIAYNNSDSGIELHNSSNNTLASNRVYENIREGFESVDSGNNMFTSNTANNNTREGFYFIRSSNNIFTSNTANNSIVQGGFYFSNSQNNMFTSNTANNNNREGFYFSNSANNTLTSNTVNNNIRETF
ncbi:MAG: right-handed parallel beta-helix repeat-containing protein, partial [Nanoarchaeota archaeon]|nr:right-handed parallel beta-helix repeat-containing protein [Nanoarchaeota archaeon]